MLQSELEINKKYAKTKGMKIVNSQMYTHDWAQKGLAMTKKKIFTQTLYRLYRYIVQSKLLANLF